MHGLLLRLLDDRRGSPGRWFWPCFKPLRSTFDRHFWIFSSQPWMGAPAAFDYERDSALYAGAGETTVCLWRPGAVGRWAHQFCAEDIELWATNPAEDPARLASGFCRTSEEGFIEEHAEIWLIYSDSTCWEIFATRAPLLQTVRGHLWGNASIRVYDHDSRDRGRAYARAGVGNVWRAMNGQAS